MGLGRYPGAIGAFVQGGAQGMQDVQELRRRQLQNEYTQNAMVNPAIRVNAEDTAAYNAFRNANPNAGLGVPQYSNSAQMGPFDPVMAKIKGLISRATGHQPGPSSQGTVNQQTNQAASAPQPTTASTGGGGAPQGSPNAAFDEGRSIGGGMQPQYAEGGSIGDPRGVTPITGIKPRKPKKATPRNTEASPSMPGGGNLFADGGAPDPSQAEMVQRAAANRARNPASVASSTQSASNDTTIPKQGPVEPESGKATGLEPAQAAPKGVLNRVKGAAKGLGGAWVAGSSLAGAETAAGTDTEEYRKRFGMETNDPSLAGDIGVRALGAASDVGNAMTGGGLRKLHDTMYPDRPWNANPPPKPAADPNQLQEVNPTARYMDMPGGAGAASHAAPAGGGGAASVDTPQAPVDMSKVNFDHSEIPNVSSEEWKGMKQHSIAQLVARGIPVQQAQIQVDDQISDYQHRQFMQMMQQGIALDRAGDKPGAMRALRTAYQYMPTGHDIQLGLDPKTGNIVGSGVDEKTGQPLGKGVLLDQKNLQGLLAAYSDPNAFRKEAADYQEMELRKNTFNKVTVPGAAAQRYEQYARGSYFNQRNQTQEDVAGIRASAAGARGRMSPKTEPIYRDTIEKTIMDPRDQSEAMMVAGEMEQRYGSDESTAHQIAGRLGQVYSYPPGPQREQAAAAAGIRLPAHGPAADPNKDYQALYGGGGGTDYSTPGYGNPPRQ